MFMRLFFLLVASMAHASIDLPFSVATTRTAVLSNQLTYGIGARFAIWPWEINSWCFGFDSMAAVYFRDRQGTPEVYMDTTLGGLEGRFLAGYSFRGNLNAFIPYAFIGVNGQLGTASQHVFQSSARVLDYGFFGLMGLGIQTEISRAVLRLDTGVGYGLSGLTLQTILSIGANLSSTIHTPKY